MTDPQFSRLLSICEEIGRLYEPGLVFIGGIAVFLHASNIENLRELAEATHDADIYISIAGFADLRDIEELSANLRLSKHEFRKGGFSFGVYTERHAALPVPYAQVAAHAHVYDGVRVAAPEDLLALKLEAAINRRESEHGRKDRKDIIRLLLVAAELTSGDRRFDPARACAFMTPAHHAMLHEVVKGPEFLSLALGNAKQAKALRGRCAAVLARIDQAFGE